MGKANHISINVIYR